MRRHSSVGADLYPERSRRVGPPSVRAWLRRIALAAWRALREWSGDAAYDRYLRVVAARPDAQPALRPAEFYLEQLNRRYSRPTRCC